jgi:hypothetical protein
MKRPLWLRQSQSQSKNAHPFWDQSQRIAAKADPMR